MGKPDHASIWRCIRNVVCSGSAAGIRPDPGRYQRPDQPWPATGDPGWRIGDEELLRAVLRVRPRLAIFGHSHSGYGQVQVGGTLYVNCALAGDDGAIRMSVVVDL